MTLPDRLVEGHRARPGDADDAQHLFAARLLRAGEASDDVADALREAFGISQTRARALIADALRRVG